MTKVRNEATGPLVILQVEDNLADVRLTREALREGNISNRLVVANDGIEALAFLRREGPYAEAPRPDLILLDLNMPRMDGRQVLAELKRDPHLRRIPVVILTTSKAEEDIAEAYDSRANCFITKPVDFDEFVAVVRSVDAFWLRVNHLPVG